MKILNNYCVVFDRKQREEQDEPEVDETNTILKDFSLDSENADFNSQRWSFSSMKRINDDKDDSDDVSLYKNSNISLKCFVSELIDAKNLNLLMELRNKFQFYILVAIYYGIGKPPVELMRKIFKKVLKSLTYLKRIPLSLSKEKFTIMFKAHTYGCSLCLTSFTSILSRPVYPSANGCTLRTRNSIIDDVNYVISNKHMIDSHHKHKKKFTTIFRKYCVSLYNNSGLVPFSVGREFSQRSE
uniref:THAP-type domain-containing protein n=1 Tax=Strongyloides venezuelensis TaxID=75913 RepID=A0A0K0FPX0_STRVS